jgi:hypothetical protein
VKRQLKTYTVTIGVTTRTEDNPEFGTVTVQATDALAAAQKVNVNLGKLQYVAEVLLASTVVVRPDPIPAPAPPAGYFTLGEIPHDALVDDVEAA